jgi:hypothetical protein
LLPLMQSCWYDCRPMGCWKKQVGGFGVFESAGSTKAVQIVPASWPSHGVSSRRRARRRAAVGSWCQAVALVWSNVAAVGASLGWTGERWLGLAPGVLSSGLAGQRATGVGRKAGRWLLLVPRVDAGVTNPLVWINGLVRHWGHWWGRSRPRGPLLRQKFGHHRSIFVVVVACRWTRIGDSVGAQLVCRSWRLVGDVRAPRRGGTRKAVLQRTLKEQRPNTEGFL